ncbi:MAG: hypothetical protein IJM30_06240 [Thermoguttaceae bacterium]|nr:hypothetical protein [Thermoguttaceae bacterium]
MTGKEIAEIMNGLFRVHRQIGDLKYRVRLLERSVEAREKEFREAELNLSERLDSKRRALLVVDENERAAATAASELERRREQLNSAKSDREYEALKIQIELEEKKNDSLADQTLEALSALDEISAEIASAEERVRTADSNLNKARATREQESNKLKIEIERALARLKESELKIPRDFVGFYRRCVDNYGGEGALAPLCDGGYCGSCNCQLPPDEVARVCDGAAICCSSCGRLLFAPEQFAPN